MSDSSFSDLLAEALGLMDDPFSDPRRLQAVMEDVSGPRGSDK
jgi:hypothetical protein